jgi:hypothetical protein
MLAIVAPAVGLGVNMPSGRLVAALVPVLLLVAGLIVYCLIDLIRAQSVRYLPKPVWALIIVLGSAPLGALAYLAFGKDHHGHDLNETPGHVAARH